MTGLAAICAEEVETALGNAGVASETLLMDGLGADALDDFDTILIISSTYGHGDIPDNGQALYEALETVDTLAGKRFAVFALGDRTYMDTFCHAGEKWDALFADKGATRIAQLERHDASAGTLAEDEAGEWAAGWAGTLSMAA
ncbi:MAG: flavodoxin domain-containing protein [Sphingobium sp.]|nr:flavodoxin domain-containing protein [Sphingobium sp.]